MNYITTASATSAPQCGGSNQQGRYVRDSTVGMIYQCPVCRREFVHHPYWAMSATSSQSVFFIPVHGA